MYSSLYFGIVSSSVDDAKFVESLDQCPVAGMRGSVRAMLRSWRVRRCGARIARHASEDALLSMLSLHFQEALALVARKTITCL
jgi:hypothetical protein